MANQSITVELDDEAVRCLAAVGKPIDVLARLAYSAADGLRNRHPQRDQTDVSLRIERAEADDYEAKEREAREKQEDEREHTGRHSVGQLAQAARADAERQRGRSPTGEADAEFERARAVLEDQRSSSDVALGRARAEARRSRADILAAERQTTDNDLTGERTNTDALIADGAQRASAVGGGFSAAFIGAAVVALGAALVTALAIRSPSASKARVPLPG